MSTPSVVGCLDTAVSLDFFLPKAVKVRIIMQFRPGDSGDRGLC